MEKLTLPKGYSQYGAQMGRPDQMPVNQNAPIKLQMERLKWVDGDYDQSGAYWGGGNGDWIYCAHGEDAEVAVKVFVRAVSREHAKTLVRKSLPFASFYR